MYRWAILVIWICKTSLTSYGFENTNLSVSMVSIKIQFITFILLLSLNEVNVKSLEELTFYTNFFWTAFVSKIVIEMRHELTFFNICFINYSQFILQNQDSRFEINRLPNKWKFLWDIKWYFDFEINSHLCLIFAAKMIILKLKLRVLYTLTHIISKPWIHLNPARTPYARTKYSVRGSPFSFFPNDLHK